MVCDTSPLPTPHSCLCVPLSFAYSAWYLLSSTMLYWPWDFPLSYSHRRNWSHCWLVIGFTLTVFCIQTLSEEQGAPRFCLRSFNSPEEIVITACDIMSTVFASGFCWGLPTASKLNSSKQRRFLLHSSVAWWGSVGWLLQQVCLGSYGCKSLNLSKVAFSCTHVDLAWMGCLKIDEYLWDSK